MHAVYVFGAPRAPVEELAASAHSSPRVVIWKTASGKYMVESTPRKHLAALAINTQRSIIKGALATTVWWKILFGARRAPVTQLAALAHSSFSVVSIKGR